jgi:hypothetical protein
MSRAGRTSFLVLAVLVIAPSVRAGNPDTYRVGNIPVAGTTGSVEFPVHGALAAEVDLGIISQGTYTDRSPFAYLSAVMPAGWLHYDAVRDLRLSLGFQESLYQEVRPLGITSWHEERGIVRARFQQPRGAAALYEILQLDLRSFEDAGGTRRFVYRPRFRLGQGFNLDAERINSLVFYQEVGLRFSADGYTQRAFEFFRTLAGYTWTTRRGTFVTLGIIGQISLNPAATRYDVLWGPVLGISHRFRAAAPEAPPAPVDVEVQ